MRYLMAAFLFLLLATAADAQCPGGRCSPSYGYSPSFAPSYGSYGYSPYYGQARGDFGPYYQRPAPIYGNPYSYSPYPFRDYGYGGGGFSIGPGGISIFGGGGGYGRSYGGWCPTSR